MEDLLDSYPDFELKDTPQGLESFINVVKFIVENSNSLVPYPIFYVATYFQTAHVQYKALQSAIMQLYQEVSTDISWSENLAD